MNAFHGNADHGVDGWNGPPFVSCGTLSVGRPERPGMPDDDDIALTEKRMYGARREGTRVYVAGALGVAYVDVSDDQIGRFGLAHRCRARDVAGEDGRLLVATDEDVLVGGEEFADAGFGPAVAVGFADGPVAAGPDGRVARLGDDGWTTLGTLPAVRRLGGGYAATAEGVYDLEGVHVGLDDARDVAAGYAATVEGVFRRADGWDLEEAGDATVVATDGERAHAVVDGTLLERSEAGWWDADAPVTDPVDVAYGAATFAVTADGRLALDPPAAKDGAPEWRSRELGLDDVTGLAVP